VTALRTTLVNQSSRTAIVYGSRSVTFGELDQQARTWAAWFQELGVAVGDRVAIVTSAKMSFLTAHLGALYSGAVSLPLNPRSTARELQHFLLDSGARVVVTGDQQRELIESTRTTLPELHTVLADATDVFGSPSRFSEPALSCEHPCLLLYSSGTTGRPKGVMHTQGNLASSLQALQEIWQFTADDILVNVLPLFHIHGLSFATHLSLLTGSCMLMDDVFHPRRTMELIGQGTVFMAIPTFYYSFLDRPEFATAARGWRNVRLFTCGSAPIRAEVLPELESILGRPVINRYGMTEAHVVTSLPLGGPWPGGSVGIPLRGIEVRVVKPDGTPMDPGEAGSVELRGPNLFRGYWQQPEATRGAFTSGWFDTGDLGCQDAAGFLTLVGRKNDMIITSGFNVYPQVVERVINSCLGVQESAVVGVPDLKRGERVVAVVVRSSEVLTLSEDTLRSYLNERLVDYQRPAAFIFVEAIPRNAMGKVVRRDLLGIAASGRRP
jgi:malonyl-CoA/methylmalonyl-CoA synthetase